MTDKTIEMALIKYIKHGIKYIAHGQPKNDVRVSISLLEPSAKLSGKKIIVTGGGRGLGYAMAKKFISEGAQVLITGRNEETLKKTAGELQCLYLTLDIRKIEDFDEFFSKAGALLDGPDCLVNNAGISLHEGNIRNVTGKGFDDQIATNLRGGYFLAQKFISYYESHDMKNGNILFISSERGIYADDIPYGLTKAAVNSLVQGLANRVIGEGIRVNAIAPGVTASEMTGYSPEGNLYCDYNITGRVYLPEEVAEVASFMLSDASKCLSGQILVCNEGKSINSYWR